MNMYGNPQMQPMGGYYYQGMQPQQIKQQMNVLSDEEIKELMSNQDSFTLALTNRELLQSYCNHRKPGGMGDSLVDDGDGYVKCTICGARFRVLPDNMTQEEIMESIEQVENIVQTIKIMYVDMPTEAAKEIYPIVPMMQKLGKLFSMAAKNAAKYESNFYQYNNGQGGVFSMLNNLTNFLGQGGPMMNPGYGYQQPMMGQPMMNQPAPNMMAGYPQQAYAQQNAFGYPGAQAPQQGYQPGTPNGFAYTPGMQAAPPQAAAPVTPVAPAAPDGAAPDKTVTQNVSI